MKYTRYIYKFTFLIVLGAFMSPIDVMAVSPPEKQDWCQDKPHIAMAPLTELVGSLRNGEAVIDNSIFSENDWKYIIGSLSKNEQLELDNFNIIKNDRLFGYMLQDSLARNASEKINKLRPVMQKVMHRYLSVINKYKRNSGDIFIGQYQCILKSIQIHGTSAVVSLLDLAASGDDLVRKRISNALANIDYFPKESNPGDYQKIIDKLLMVASKNIDAETKANYVISIGKIVSVANLDDFYNEKTLMYLSSSFSNSEGLVNDAIGVSLFGIVKSANLSLSNRTIIANLLANKLLLYWYDYGHVSQISRELLSLRYLLEKDDMINQISTLKAIYPGLSNQDKWVRRGAIYALVTNKTVQRIIGDQGSSGFAKKELNELLNKIILALNDSDDEVRSHAVELFTIVPVPNKFIENLIPRLTDSSLLVKYNTAIVFSRLEYIPESAVGPLCSIADLFGDYAIKALAKNPEGCAFPTLIKLLGRKDSSFVINSYLGGTRQENLHYAGPAFDALVKIGKPAILPLLNELDNEKNDIARKRIFSVLNCIKEGVCSEKP